LCGGEYRRIPNLGAQWFEVEGKEIHLGDRIHLLPPEEETYPDQI